MTKKPSLSMIDLFAGCGGLSLGMENSGFTPVFVNELNPHAMATYLANRAHFLGGLPFSERAELHSNDANELQGERLEQVVRDLSELGLVFPSSSDAQKGKGSGTLDLLAGGPPCQGYSGIGHRRSYAVDKKDLPSNQLYGRMTKIIRRLRPKIFLFENVRGILTSKWTREGDDRIWPNVWGEFRKIPGYTVRFSLVRAADYGVPQNRPRVLLVGIRDDVLRICGTQLLAPSADDEDAVKCGFLPSPQPSDAPHLADLLSDLEDPQAQNILEQQRFEKGRFETVQYPKPPQNELQRKLRTPPKHFADRADILTDHEYSKHASRIVEKFSHMIANNGQIPEKWKTKKFSQKVLPANWGNARPSITATSMPDDYVHYSQPRILTVREWARLQLFPDWYRFEGKRTTGGFAGLAILKRASLTEKFQNIHKLEMPFPLSLPSALGRTSSKFSKAR